MAPPPSASTSALLLLLLTLLFLLTLGAAARPCKTLFISYAVSSTGHGIASSGSLVSAPREQVSSTSFTVYRISPLREYRNRSYSSSFSSTRAYAETLVASLRLPVGDERPFLRRLPVVQGKLSLVGGSVGARARDVLAVVAGLLFGVGCGGLASVAMYLTCFLINNHHEAPGSHGYGLVGKGDGDGGVEIPKKMGYTELPAMPATLVAPLKEGYGEK